MSGLGLGKLTDRQEKAIIALLAQPTQALAAQAAGIGQRTLYRWLEDPTFIAAYCRARRHAFNHAVAQAQRYAPLAIDTWARVCNNPKAADSDKIRAAFYLVRFGREAIELDEILSRLQALEDKSGQTPGPIDTTAVEVVANDGTPMDAAGLPAPDAAPAVPRRRGRKPKGDA